MTPRAILFDLDGTLIDQFQAIHRAFSLTMEKMGFPRPSFETVKKSSWGCIHINNDKTHRAREGRRGR